MNNCNLLQKLDAMEVQIVTKEKTQLYEYLTILPPWDTSAT